MKITFFFEKVCYNSIDLKGEWAKNPTLSCRGSEKVIEEIKKMIEPIINENGYYLDSVSFVMDGNVKNLEVVIDKDGIIEVEDCVIVSKLINPILDEKDPISEFYVLDVCSKEKGCE